MISTVRSRPNHYEVLGLTPAASSDEIAEAFGKELLRPRAFGSLAEVTIAYETLRDRIKREAYDIAIGVKPKPASPSTDAPPEWAPFLIGASAKPVVRHAINPLPRILQQPDARPRPESVEAPAAEPKMPPFVAASRPEPINSREVLPEPTTTTEEPRPETMAKPVLEPPTGGDRLHFAESGRFRFDGVALSQWKLPALAAGAMILAVSVGVWTGLESGNDNEPGRPTQAVTVKVPQPDALSAITALEPTPAPSMAEAQPERRARVDPPADRIARNRPPLQITLPEEPQAEAALVEPRKDPAIEQAVGEAPSADATTAKLPLPKAVIARTIGRIGYPCGQVANASAIGGGAFKVTCTSGHSYRAAPVRGRYRFRRLG